MYYAKDFYMLNDNDEYEEPTSIVIPSTVTSIPSHAFYNFASLESITLPEGVTSIGDHTFENCSSLRSITLPEGVTSIGDYAFRHCYSLTSIIIPEAVTSIGDYAFYNCRSLTSITLPSTLASIGNHTFENCSSLENVYYNGTIEEWLNIKFERYDSNPMDYAKHFYMLNDNDEYEEVTNIKIPNTITVIPNYTFCGFDITSIEIPEGVTSIGDYAFYNCRSLENVYYNGTIEQWLNIEFGSYNGNPMDYANHLYVLGEDGNYYEATELL